MKRLRPGGLIPTFVIFVAIILVPLGASAQSNTSLRELRDRGLSAYHRLPKKHFDFEDSRLFAQAFRHLFAFQELKKDREYNISLETKKTIVWFEETMGEFKMGKGDATREFVLKNKGEDAYYRAVNSIHNKKIWDIKAYINTTRYFYAYYIVSEDPTDDIVEKYNFLQDKELAKGGIKADQPGEDQNRPAGFDAWMPNRPRPEFESQKTEGDSLIGNPVISVQLPPVRVKNNNDSRERSANLQTGTPKRFLLRFSNSYLDYQPQTDRIQVVAQNTLFSYGEDIKVKQMKEYLYHVKQRFWEGFYWKVNTSHKKVYRVERGAFGEYGGRDEVLNIEVEIYGEENNPWRFILNFSDAYLVHRPGRNGAQIHAQNNVLSYGEDIKIVQMKDYLYHTRWRTWNDFFWKINTSREKAYKVNGGTFGEYGGEEQILNLEVDPIY